jgi:RimJ/RimL family protein N-acetyltransferase
MKQIVRIVVPSTLASFVGFAVHRFFADRLPAWVSQQMEGVQIKMPPYGPEVVVPATLSSLESGVAFVVAYALLRRATPTLGVLVRALLLAGLCLGMQGAMLRMPLMQLVVGNPVWVTVVQHAAIWLPFLLESLAVALAYEAILRMGPDRSIERTASGERRKLPPLSIVRAAPEPHHLMSTIRRHMQPLGAHLPAVRRGTAVRLLQESDVERFHAYRSDAELATYQGWSPMSLPSARRFIEEMASVSELRRGDWVQLGIADAATDVLVGDVGLYLEPDESSVEIGFTLDREAQGSGHATRGVEASLSLVFAVTAAKVVRAVTDARNAKSIRVLERVGFARSHTRQAVFKGETCTEWVYVYNRENATPTNGDVPRIP